MDLKRYEGKWVTITHCNKQGDKYIGSGRVEKIESSILNKNVLIYFNPLLSRDGEWKLQELEKEAHMVNLSKKGIRSVETETKEGLISFCEEQNKTILENRLKEDKFNNFYKQTNMGFKF